MNHDDLQFGQPLACQNLIIIPVVRKVIIRTQDWISGAVSPVALVILDGHEVSLALLDDGITRKGLTQWLNENGICSSE